MTNVHAMDDKRAGYSQDVGGVVWAELLVLSKDCDATALQKMTEGGFEKGCSLWRQPYDLILARLAPDSDLVDVVALPPPCWSPCCRR